MAKRRMQRFRHRHESSVQRIHARGGRRKAGLPSSCLNQAHSPHVCMDSPGHVNEYETRHAGTDGEGLKKETKRKAVQGSERDGLYLDWQSRL